MARDVSWAFGVSAIEVLRFGAYPWWWKLRWATWQEFRYLDIKSLAQKQGADTAEEFSYGETPTATLARILELCELPKGARFLDLGSGRGLSVIAAALMGYRAFGMEVVEEYVKGSQRVAKRMKVNAEIRKADFLIENWPSADLYQVNSTAFPLEFREKLVHRMQGAEMGALISTYDWNLTFPEFEQLHELRLPVTRGTVLWRLFRRT